MPVRSVGYDTSSRGDARVVLHCNHHIYRHDAHFFIASTGRPVGLTAASPLDGRQFFFGREVDNLDCLGYNLGTFNEDLPLKSS